MPRFASLLVALLSVAVSNAGLHAALPAVEEVPVTVPDFGPRFKEIHERIDALYRNRNGNYPLPDPQLSLFRPSIERAVAPETTKEAAPVEAPPDPEVVLRQAVATLKGGIVRSSDGDAYLFMNQKRYREGDTVPVRIRDKTLSLTVKRVTTTSVILVYDNAEITVSANQLR